MSKIQLATLPALELITRHDSHLHLRSSCNQFCQFIHTSPDILRTCLCCLGQGIALKPLHRTGIIPAIIDQERLQQFRSTRKKLPARKILKHLRAHICKFRLTDHTENILIIVEIHPCLASDSSIHLSQECSRDIRRTHSPFIYSCSKPHNVRSHAATDCQHQGIPVSSLLHQPRAHLQHRIHGLGLLRSLDQHSRHALSSEDLRQHMRRRALRRHLAVHHRKHTAVVSQLGLQCIKPAINENTADTSLP